MKGDCGSLFEGVFDTFGKFFDFFGIENRRDGRKSFRDWNACKE